MEKSELMNKEILLVDDDVEIRESMRELLEMKYPNVRVAKNGEEALKLYEEKMPDIILTDLQMPIMNGLELLKRIKTIDPKKPVVVITAFDDQAHFAEGADAILIKPINRKKLFQLIDEFLL